MLLNNDCGLWLCMLSRNARASENSSILASFTVTLKCKAVK